MDLRAETLEWIWNDDTAVRLRDGLELNLNGERRFVEHSHLHFEVRWLSGLDCLKTTVGQIELQYRFLRLAAGVLGATTGTLIVLLKHNHWILISALITMLGVCIFPVLSVGPSWIALFVLGGMLYALGSRI